MSFPKILTFSFLDHNSKNNQNLKKVSIKVPFKADYPSYD